MTAPRSALSLVLVVAAAGGGYLAGSAAGSAPGDDALAGENERLRSQVLALERDLAARPVPLAAGAVAARDVGGGDPTSAGPRVALVGSPVPAVDVPFPKFDAATTPDEFVAACFAFLEAQLARGADGHLAILKAIDEHLVKDKSLQKMFASEEDTARFLYPLLKFTVTHEAEVVELLATTFRTMAEAPQTFAELDDDTLELFTEGVAMALPGAVSGERLAAFVGWAETVVAAPRGSLPRSIEGNRGEIGRLLTMWAPPLGVEQALALLAQPESLPAERIASLLRRLPPEARSRIDVPRVVGPLIDQGNYYAIRLLEQVAVAPGDLAVLDRRQIAALGTGRAVPVRSYLAATGRPTFEAGRAFYDAWGASPDLQADAYAYAVIQAQAPAAYLRDVAARTKPSDAARKALETMIERLERAGAGPR